LPRQIQPELKPPGEISETVKKSGCDKVPRKEINGNTPKTPAQENDMEGKGYHEQIDKLSSTAKDMHRAIMSLMEEMEAVDWYDQRIEVCRDKELKAILEHNRDEEKEHAAMILEWIRRHDKAFDKELKDYLFSEKSIAHK
jgi:ferritin-like protein